MSDIFSRKKRSEIMSKVRSKDSRIEVEFRKKMWRAGFRYRKNAKNYFGKPDIVLPKYKTVIFVDSCFWHGCDKHYSIPKTRVDFWKNKIKENKRRDREVDRHYVKEGWSIIRIWEHDLKNSDKIINKINRKTGNKIAH